MTDHDTNCIKLNFPPTEEVIRIDSEGFHYRGQFIADAGEAHRLLVQFLNSTPMTDCSPVKAGFDGAKGIRMNNPTMQDGGRFQLKRGKTKPSESPHSDFREQLVWLYPDDAPSRLMWCNAEDQWFELTFTPFDKP